MYPPPQAAADLKRERKRAFREQAGLLLYSFHPEMPRFVAQVRGRLHVSSSSYGRLVVIVILLVRFI
jgi:hypothetical protein